jgi:hypothetical protein
VATPFLPYVRNRILFFSALRDLFAIASDLSAAEVSRVVRSGREVRGYLHHPRAWPLRAVAPVRILPCVAPVPDAAAAAAGSAAVGSARKGEQPEACRARERAPLTPSTRVWVFVHRAAVAEAREALENAISIINSEIQKEIREEMMANHENQSVAESVAESMVDERLVDIAPEQPQVCRFQLRGPQSHAVLVRALQLARGGDARPPGDAPPFGDAPPPGVETPPCGDAPSTPTSIPGVENAKAWSSLCHLASPAPLPPNALLALRVTHPRTAPTPRPPPGASDAESSSAAPSGPSGHSPSTSPRLTAQLSQLLHQWPSSLGASALFSESSGSFSETCPFASDPPLPLAASSYPLLLVQEPPVAGGAGGGSRGRSRASSRRGGFGSGWDVLLPASVASAFWHALILAGARAAGHRELRLLSLHAESDQFPYDHPDTLCGQQREQHDAGERMRAYMARPPSRRPNFRALRVSYPFSAGYAGVLGEGQFPPTAQAADSLPTAQAADSLEAHIEKEADEVPSDRPRARVPPHAGASPPHAGASRAPFVPVRGEPLAGLPLYPICVLRGPRIAAALEGEAGEGEEARTRPALPRAVQGLLQHCLFRVILRFPRKGGARPPAMIHSATGAQLDAWRREPRWTGLELESKGGGGRVVGGDPGLTACGPLVGFVSNGGYDVLAGHSVAIGMCAATSIVELLQGPCNLGRNARGPLLLMVRNVTSRQFRPALATVRA